jgi:hypothetical protein
MAKYESCGCSRLFSLVSFDMRWRWLRTSIGFNSSIGQDGHVSNGVLLGQGLYAAIMCWRANRVLV